VGDFPEVLDEVDDDELEDFDDKEDTLDVTEEQWSLVASFETTRRDRAGQQLMDAERQAQRKVKDMAQRAARVEAHQGRRPGAPTMT
jgi:hypothetical protein